MTTTSIRHPFTGLAFRGLSIASAALGAALLAAAASAQSAAAPPVLESEEPFTAKMPPLSLHWGFVRGGFESGVTRIINGDTGKIVGTIATSRWSDLGLDPTNKFYYVSETIWTKINRGTRQDFVAVYDPTTLNLVSEFPLPGRLIIGAEKHNFSISDDGKTGFIYNFSPTSSVNVVDLEKRKLSQVVELPGCAKMIPIKGVGFGSLCSDGTIATVALAGKTPVTTHSAPFFSATNDPVFEAFALDRAKQEITMVSFTGLVYSARLGATTTVSAPWSLQAAAGLRPGDTKPLDVNWLPGGRQLLALHRASGTLYVLMHVGEYWTQVEPGEELWVVDLANKKILKRVPLKHKISNIEITQDDKPLIFASGEGSTTWIFDATTFEQKFEIERAGGGVIGVIESK